MFRLNLVNDATPLFVVGSERTGLVLATWQKGEQAEYIVWNYYDLERPDGSTAHTCEYGVYFKTLNEAQDYLARKIHGDMYPTI